MSEKRSSNIFCLKKILLAPNSLPVFRIISKKNYLNQNKSVLKDILQMLHFTKQ